MLQLRPNCEHCDKDLPADSEEARICSYECTFCCDCVEHVLENVCPNCGGGLVPRPIRPATAWRDGVSRAHQMPSVERILKPVDVVEHEVFCRPLKEVLPVAR